MIMEELGFSYHEARQVAAAGSIFTTHTPVAAGFDRFDPGLVDKYFREYCREPRPHHASSSWLTEDRPLRIRASRSTWRTWPLVTAHTPTESPSCTGS